MNPYIGELKGIWNNKKLTIALIGIVVMPLLYGGLLIWSFWDPYSQMDQLPVAIVNEDRGAEMDGEMIRAGDDFVEELKKDPPLDFHFVTKQEAKQGMEDFSYYFYVEIPEDFSENLVSVKEKEPVQAVISYEINEDYNYVSSQIATKAIEEMEKELSDTLTLTYIEIANDAFSELTSAVLALHEGSDELADGNERAANHMETLANGLQELTNGAESLAKGIDEAKEGTGQFRSQFEQLQQALEQTTSDLDIDNMFREALELTRNGIMLLESEKYDRAADVFDELDQKLTAINQQLSDAEKAATQLEQEIQNIQEMIENLQQSNEGMTASFQADENGINQSFEQVSSNMSETLQSLERFDEQLETSEQEIAHLSHSVDTLPGIMENVDPRWKDNDDLVQWYDDLASTTAKLSELNDDFHAAVDSQEQLPHAMNQLNKSEQEILTTLEQLEENVQQFQQTTGDLDDTLVTATNELLKPLADIQQLLQTMQETLPSSLPDQTDSFREGKEQLLESLYHVEQGLERGETLYLEVLTAQDKAYEGIVALDEGLKQLSDGSHLLATKLAEASDGSHELLEGLRSLKDGARNLEVNLQKLKDVLFDVDPNASQEKMVANPIVSNSKNTGDGHSYGEGLTPYFLSIGLYVGGLTLSIIYPFREPLAPHANGRQWFIGKLGVIYTVGTLQSVLILLFLFFGIGLEVKHPLLFVPFTIFTSLTFLTLIFLLVGVLDNPGRFVAIILLILQLGGSAGSFPVELLASPLQTLHGWLPMTYSVLGFRSVLFMNSPSLLSSSLWFMGILLILCFAGALFFYMKLYPKWCEPHVDRNM
ncbi:YhgE/Pip domain-containing protein [Halalkalibacterium halodurans]|uniref:ABC-2 type transporter transmembrane domain-containing protein n=1 Tax=Halalkalibacterium halodurans TaxID=86665 RepID=A0A0M0KJQ1_ALKHA|nr:YhgE/Pip domain-containing protein [Halalkalibacterium halodurans]MED3647626.1 YhgE/Pip domain-containing protein [Halalkalibacterium halodurans]TPE68791.1 YhgE/Pip domain-containing protein [Halalkalibacterium halodurans]